MRIHFWSNSSLLHCNNCHMNPRNDMQNARASREQLWLWRCVRFCLAQMHIINNSGDKFMWQPEIWCLRIMWPYRSGAQFIRQPTNNHSKVKLTLECRVSNGRTWSTWSAPIVFVSARVVCVWLQVHLHISARPINGNVRYVIQRDTHFEWPRRPFKKCPRLSSKSTSVRCCSDHCIRFCCRFRTNRQIFCRAHLTCGIKHSAPAFVWKWDSIACLCVCVHHALMQIAFRTFECIAFYCMQSMLLWRL